MRWIRRKRRRYIDWDAWEPVPIARYDWSRYRVGDRLPPAPRWIFLDDHHRPGMEPEEYAAMPWWDRLRWDLTFWDPRDRSKFDRVRR